MKLINVISLLIGLIHALNGQGIPIITTIAGGGPNNVAALNAGLDQPTGGAVDSAGNFYFAGASQVFRLSPAGQLTVVAGVSAKGSGGDGGQATRAGLYLPFAVALDGLGNLYIADNRNNRVRKVVLSTGIITTIAGNGSGCGNSFTTFPAPATSVCIWRPTGVAIEASGNVLVVDSGTLWRLTVSTGLIDKVSEFSNAQSVHVDGAGNIYVARGCAISKILASTGVINTFAGNGTCGYTGDGGPATSATLYNPTDTAIDGLGNLYIADTQYNIIRRVDAATGIIKTVAGTGSFGFGGDGGQAKNALLWKPAGLGLDAAGNLLISDYFNKRIRKIATNGVINTVAGNGLSYSSGDGGLAINAGLAPSSVAYDDAGNMYIASDIDNNVRRVDVSTGQITTIAGTGVSGSSGDNGPGTLARLNQPQFVIASGNQYLYISDLTSVRRLNLISGIISTVAGNGAAGSGCVDGGSATSQQCFTFPSGLALEKSGNLLVADLGEERVYSVNLSAGTIRVVAGDRSIGPTGVGDVGDGRLAVNANLYGPSGLTVDSGGNLFIADKFHNRIRRVDAATGIISTVAGIGARGYFGDGVAASSAVLNQPRGVALDGLGNLFFSEVDGSSYTTGIGNRVRRVTLSTGIISTIAGCRTDIYVAGTVCVYNGDFLGDGGPAVTASLVDPFDIVFFGSNLIISDRSTRRVRSVTNPGVQPLSISLTHSGNFLQFNNGVFTAQITNSSGVATTGAVSISIGIYTEPDVGCTGACIAFPAISLKSLSGSGWTCPTNDSCTRSDSLAPGQNYPLTITVATSAASSKSQTVEFRVTGGGLPPTQSSDSVLVVLPSPALSVTKSHVGNFSQSQQGASFTIRVRNTGSGPTSGTVTVTDTLPAGLSLVAMTGSGWSCTSNTCTRADALAAGASYPDITVATNVAANAASSVTNTVSVSGGSASASASDTVTINVVLPSPAAVYVFREDFETLSDYSFVPTLPAGTVMTVANAPLWPEGTYTITTNPQGVHPLFCSFGDHTTGSSRMLVANGRGGKVESVWARTVSGLTAGIQYRLSVWVASAYHTAPAILRFNLDGQQVGTAITAPTTGASCPGTASTPIWQQLSVIFTAPSTQVAINLQDTNLQPSGNDFAIDDIELVPVAGGIAVFKEDFEVLSDYQYVAPLTAGVPAPTGTAPLWPEGTYTIITSPQTNHPLFCSFVDHTTGSGRMLVANGRGGKVESIWSRTVSGLTVGSQYRLSVWAANAHHASPATLRFTVDGVVAGQAMTLPVGGASCPGTPSSPLWQQLVVTFTAQSPQAVINLQDTNLTAGGNDIAIDDIELTLN